MNDTPRKAWTRKELLLAINLYCRTPFGKIHVRNPDIIELAELLGRTPGSVSYKLANFASIDPSLDRVGASNTSKLDRETWSEFFADWEKMVLESEQEFQAVRGQAIKKEEEPSIPEGKTRESVVRTRVNQQFFRKMVLSSYDSRCCITGLPVKELLVASHIIPWSIDTRNRLNPANGLCLNSLHDMAFDQGFITIGKSYKVIVSDELRKTRAAGLRMITDYHDTRITMPSRFIPNQEFLSYHRENIFRR